MMKQSDHRPQRPASVNKQPGNVSPSPNLGNADQLRREVLRELGISTGSWPIEAGHAVGYRKPPLSGRFVKGKSGNPSGRPRKHPNQPAIKPDAGPSSVTDMIRKELLRDVKAQEGGKSIEMPMTQALLKNLEKISFCGGVHATNSLLAMTIEAAERWETEVANNHRFWHDYCATYRRAAGGAENNGQPAPSCLPHPDDVRFKPGELVQIRGPLNLQGLLHYQQLEKLRNALIAKDIYDVVFFQKQQDRYAGRPGMSSSLLYRILIDRSLPKSMQVAGNNYFNHLTDLASWQSNKLVNEVTQAWAKLGASAPIQRCARFVDAKYLKQLGLDPCLLSQIPCPERHGRGRFRKAT